MSGLCCEHPHPNLRHSRPAGHRNQYISGLLVQEVEPGYPEETLLLFDSEGNGFELTEYLTSKTAAVALAKPLGRNVLTEARWLLVAYLNRVTDASATSLSFPELLEKVVEIDITESVSLCQKAARRFPFLTRFLRSSSSS